MGSVDSVSLTFSLLDPPSKLQKAQQYYLSLATPGYHVRGYTESRTAPGEFVYGIILPAIVPSNAYLLVRLHREKTRHRVAKYHEVEIRVDRIRLVVMSHFVLRFEDAPGVLIHVETLPREPCASACFRAQTQFASEPHCWPLRSAPCATVVSRCREDGTWAPVLHSGELPNQTRRSTPLIYEPGKADTVVLRIDVFAVPTFGHHLKRLATMVCSLHFLLNAQKWSRLVLYRPQGRRSADLNEYRIENNTIAGMIHMLTSKGLSSDLVASIELSVVLFGHTGTPADTLNLNATRKWEKSMPPLPPSSNPRIPENLRTVYLPGKWKSNRDRRALSSLSYSVRALASLELLSSSSTLHSINDTADPTDNSENSEHSNSTRSPCNAVATINGV